MGSRSRKGQKPPTPHPPPNTWPPSQQHLVGIHRPQNSKTIVVSLLTFFFLNAMTGLFFFLLLRKINIF